MRRVCMMALLIGLSVAGAPTRAGAEGFVSPWLGVNFGHDPAEGRAAFGAGAGYMGGGIFGAEFDVGYSPNFFGTENDFGNNNVTTAMGNIIVGIPIGGTTGGGVRPYVTGGIGLIRTDINGLFSDDAVANNDFGFNLGAGVMGFFNDHFGMRADVRYFRNAADTVDDDRLDLELGGFDFWRAYVGLVIR